MARAKGDNGSGEAVRVGVRKAYKMYVGGAFVRSESGRYTQVDEVPGSPSKENVPRASRKDGRDAVGAARAAFDGWAATTPLRVMAATAGSTARRVFDRAALKSLMCVTSCNGGDTPP